MKLQKLGGVSALGYVCVYIVGALLSSRFQLPGIWNDPSETLAAISASQNGFYLVHLLSMVSLILGFTLFVAIHERLHAQAPYLSRMMLIAGSASIVIWIMEKIIRITGVGMIVSIQDFSSFKAFCAITNGLHFTGGHACAWACLFGGCAILVTRLFPWVLGWLFLILGIIWLPTFFLLQIGIRYTIPVLILLSSVCWIWTGIAMLRQKQVPSAIK